MHDSGDGVSSRGASGVTFYAPAEPLGRLRHERLGDPGEFPTPRHAGAPRPAPEQGHDVIVRELSGEGPPRRSNEQFHYLLEHGATGLDVIGDTPTLASIDPDHPLRAPRGRQPGRLRLPRCRLRRSLRGHPARSGQLSTIRCPAASRSPGFFLAAERLGFAADVLRGSTILPPLFAEDTGYSRTFRWSCTCAWRPTRSSSAAERMPRFHPFVEDTYFISDGSVDIVDEMALGFVELREVVRRLIARGVDVDPSRRGSRCSSTAGWTSSARWRRSAPRDASTRG